MRSFLKFFLASLLAIFIFTLIAFFVLAGLVSGLLTPARVVTGSRAVLVLDLSESYMQRMQENPLSTFGVSEEYDVPGVYDIIRMI